jgi:hypothetical protein
MTRIRHIALVVCTLLLAAAGSAIAGVLPDDRGDVLYHLYDGGGVQIHGPSLLVRKKVGRQLLRRHGQFCFDRCHYDSESLH